jgi:UrcA family protein
MFALAKHGGLKVPQKRMPALRDYAFTECCMCSQSMLQPRKAGHVAGNVPRRSGLQIMKIRVSSILFGLSLFSAAAYADGLAKVTTSMTFSPALLSSDAGAASVLSDLEKQAEASCSSVSLVSIGRVVDTVCVEDILFQAVAAIGDGNLSAQYVASEYYVDTTSPRLQIASN